MKIIKVIYLSATNTLGTRLKATDGEGNTLTESMDYSKRVREQAESIANKLCKKMSWDVTLQGGIYKNEHYFTMS